MHNPLARWHQFISDHDDLEEFRTLCIYLGMAYDDLRGETNTAKARELLRYLGAEPELAYHACIS